MRMGFRQVTYGESTSKPQEEDKYSNGNATAKEIEDKKAKLLNAAKMIVSGQITPDDILKSYDRGEISKEDVEYVFSLVEQMVAEKQAEEAPAPAAQQVSAEDRKAQIKAIAHSFVTGRLTEEDLMIMNQKGELSAEEIKCILSMIKKEEAEQKLVEDVIIEDEVLKQEAPKVKTEQHKKELLANLIVQLTKKKQSPIILKELIQKGVITEKDAQEVLKKIGHVVKRKEQVKKGAPLVKEPNVRTIEKWIKALLEQKSNTRELRKQLKLGKITKDEYKIILKEYRKEQKKMKMALEKPVSTGPTVLKPEKVPVKLEPKPVQAAPPPPVLRQEVDTKLILDFLLLKEDDQKIIDQLPELLGFKFCPRLFADSGILPSLSNGSVPVEYELAYLENIKILLLQILESANKYGKEVFLGIVTENPNLSQPIFDEYMRRLFGQAEESPLEILYLSLHGGALGTDPLKVNPVFPRNFLLNVLGLRIEDILSSPQNVFEIFEAIFEKNSPLICARLETVCNAIASVKKSIAEIAAESAQVLAETLLTEDAEDVQVNNEIMQEAVAEAQIAQQEATQAQQEVANAAALAQTAQQQSASSSDDVQPAGIMDQNGQVVSTDIALPDIGVDTQDIHTTYDPEPLPKPIQSDVPAPEDVSFYKKPTNQLAIILALLAAGYYISKSGKKKSPPLSNLNPFA